MENNLKRKTIEEIWGNNEENNLNAVNKKAKALNDRLIDLKTQLINDLQKQHDELHRAKLNICISLDKQKLKLRKQIKAIKAEMAMKQ